MRPSFAFALTAAAAVLLIALPASAAQPPPDPEPTGLTGAVEQPFRDLNVIQDKTPAVLLDAAAAPYAHVAPQDCSALRNQIADLDQVLGPDLDDPAYSANGGSLLEDAVHGALHLPFSGVVRRISGARKAEEAKDRAILSGYTRRAYLKGVLIGCETPTDSPATATDSPRNGQVRASN